MTGAAIVGTGHAVPERILANGELARRLGITEEWIVTRTGIRTRRTVDGTNQATSDLALAAARAALVRARIEATTLDFIIVATGSGDYVLPATACVVQAGLGARHASAFDLNAACSSFVYGLVVANSLLATGGAKRVLLIGADALTCHVDPGDRATSILFGDGAGAVVLEPGEGLLGIHLGCDGTLAADLFIPAGGTRTPMDAAVLGEGRHKMHMNGPEVFHAAVPALVEGLVQAMARAGVRPTDLRWVFAHQANARILRAVAERIDLPLEAFWMHVERLGNTGAASIPISLSQAVEAGALKRGDLVALTAVGAGLTWGAAVLRWGGGA